MTAAVDSQSSDLEARAIQAHRAYILALIAWEDTVHYLAKPTGRFDRKASDDIGASVEAELRKETCRIAFRDLIDELGYLPKRLGIALPTEPDFDTTKPET